MKAGRVKPIATTPKRSRAVLPKESSQPIRRKPVATPTEPNPTETTGTHWTFLTNHAHVLILLARNPSVVLRKVAAQVGITERAVQRIIADLESGGILDREKIGRQNHYRIRVDQPLRHPIEAHRTVGELLTVID